MSDSTAPAPAPPPSAPHGPTTRPVWIAALAGGVLGAVFSFGLARWFPAAPKPPPPAPPSEARQFAEEVIGYLRDGKNEDFKRFLRLAFPRMTDDGFRAFMEDVFKLRAETAKAYGPAGEFEFARETPLSPSLVRVSFLEKHARGNGCILWTLVVYNAPDGWQVTAFSYDTSETGFATLK